MNSSDLKRAILRGIIVGAIAGLTLRFVGSSATDSTWLDILPPVGIVLGGLFSWRIGREFTKSEPLEEKRGEPETGL
jgi:hypothetical protein